MISQQALPFLFIFSLTSSDAFVGTRREMCTVVRLSGPDANLHSECVEEKRKWVSESTVAIGSDKSCKNRSKGTLEGLCIV